MESLISRREVLKLASLGGVVFASQLSRLSAAAVNSTSLPAEDFYFVQLSESLGL
jgi:hypothetical protein